MAKTRKHTSDVAFTPAVKRAQSERGSRDAYARAEANRPWPNTISDELAAFIAERDSVYLGTASADARPYIQHRGGPRGFIKVLDERRLAFADYRGNRQYISVGNLGENDKAFLFFMDYPNRRRVKIWGGASFVEDDPGLLDRVRDPTYAARVERALVFYVQAWDVNCRQHITPRYSLDQMGSSGVT